MPLRKAPGAVLSSKHANTQRQGAMVFWIRKVRSGSKTYLLNPKQKLLDSKATNRTKNRTSNRGAHAQECCTQCSTTCLSRRMPNAPCPYTLSILPSSKMRRALLAVGSETGDRAREQVQRVAAASISQKHRLLVARGRIGLEMAYSDANRSHAKGHA